MSLFDSGIKPEWEDEKNKQGKIFALDYFIDSDIENFLSKITRAWTDLMLSVIGDVYDYSRFINGVRFVDKTILSAGKKIMFRLEIWVNKEMKDEDVQKTKESLSKEFTCPGIFIKDM